MQRTRKATAIRALATTMVTGIVILISACSSNNSSPSAAVASPGAGVASASASAPGSAAGLGFYAGPANPSGIKTVAKWLGGSSDVKYAMDFIDATSWQSIENPYQLGQWKGTPYTMIWGVPMLPCGYPSTSCGSTVNVSDYNLVANGGADGYFKTLATNLVKAGFGTSYIRLGWEFNGTTMGWSVCNQQGSGPTAWMKDFVPAFQNIVTSMRSVAGANFQFIWNPLDSSGAGCPGVHLENLYPGNKYVDVVALDVYDGLSQPVSNTARWSDLVNGVNGGDYTAVTPDAINGQKFQGNGLTWIAAFGKENGKEVALPEWGLAATSSDGGGGGGDDPYFVTQMTKWIKANATGPAIFWNYNDGTLELDVPGDTSDATPTATAAFKTAFGG
jgi:hypothetical protein